MIFPCVRMDGTEQLLIYHLDTYNVHDVCTNINEFLATIKIISTTSLRTSIIQKCH